MAYTIIVILASNMMKFIPFTGMQKEDHLTIAIWISCFQSVFAWIYFHFHLRAPTCHFEIWSSWLMLPARKSCQWCWQSFFCQLISVPASPEQQSAIHSQPEGVTTSHWWFFICCGFHGVSCSSRSTPTSTWLMSFWCFLHRLLMFHASGFSARRGALSSLACSWFIDNICLEYQISCSFIHNQYFSMRQLFINHWWVTMNQTYTCFMADDFRVDRTGGNPVPNKARDCLYYHEQQLITGEDFMWFTWFFMLCFLILSIHANKPILLGWILQATEQVGLWIINGSITGAINSWTSISEKNPTVPADTPAYWIAPADVFQIPLTAGKADMGAVTAPQTCSGIPSPWVTARNPQKHLVFHYSNFAYRTFHQQCHSGQGVAVRLCGKSPTNGGKCWIYEPQPIIMATTKIVLH